MGFFQFDQKVTSPDFLFLVEGVSFLFCVLFLVFSWRIFGGISICLCFLFLFFPVSFWWHFVVFEKAAWRGRENKEVGDGC